MLKHLQSIGVGVYDIGGAAGIKEDANNGLATFKRDGQMANAWSISVVACLTGNNTNLFGRERQAIVDGDYFPAYRAPGLNITSFTGSKLLTIRQLNKRRLK